MGYILRVKDDKGNVIGIPSIQGESGKDGKSAYELAVANGFEGTEAEWIETHFRAFHVGTGEPDPSLGNDGDVYLKY
jgi:hypothetical protein